MENGYRIVLPSLASLVFLAVFLLIVDDAYRSALVREYVKVVLRDADWERILTKYNISWVFESANSRLSNLLIERQDWRPIYAIN